METKICIKCEKEKPLNEFFYRIDRDAIENRCLECIRKASNLYYLNNKERCKSNATRNQKIRIKERRQFVWNYLSEHPCVQCGESNPIILEFDHINPEEKDLNICRAIWNNWGMDRLEKEIKNVKFFVVIVIEKERQSNLGGMKI